MEPVVIAPGGRPRCGRPRSSRTPRRCRAARREILGPGPSLAGDPRRHRPAIVGDQAPPPGVDAGRASPTRSILGGDPRAWPKPERGAPPRPPRSGPASPPPRPARRRIRRHATRRRLPAATEAEDASGSATSPGDCVVARLHGQYDGKTALLLPDGQLGFPTRLVPTDEPFVPVDGRRACANGCTTGPYAGFQVLTTAHYLILYQSTTRSPRPAAAARRPVRGLTDAFRKHDVPVHEAEFPLVAVIFPTETRLPGPQAGRPRGPGVLRDLHQPDLLLRAVGARPDPPEVCGLAQAADGGPRGDAPDPAEHRRPAPAQRLAALAGRGPGRVLRDPDVTTKKGVAWAASGMINPLHMATIRDLDDPLSNQIDRPRAEPPGGRPSRAAARSSTWSPRPADPDRLRPGLGHDPLPGAEAGRRLRARTSRR